MIERGKGNIIKVLFQADTNIFSPTLGEDHDAGIALLARPTGAAKAGPEPAKLGLAAELRAPHNIAFNALNPLRPVATEGLCSQRPNADFSTWARPEGKAKWTLYLAPGMPMA